MAIHELSLEEVGVVSGAGLAAQIASGAGQALDYAGRGALIGATLGAGVFSPEMGAIGAAAGAVYGAGIGFLYDSNGGGGDGIRGHSSRIMEYSCGPNFQLL